MTRDEKCLMLVEDAHSTIEDAICFCDNDGLKFDLKSVLMCIEEIVDELEK